MSDSEVGPGNEVSSDAPVNPVEGDEDAQLVSSSNGAEGTAQPEEKEQLVTTSADVGEASSNAQAAEADQTLKPSSPDPQVLEDKPENLEPANPEPANPEPAKPEPEITEAKVEKKASCEPQAAEEKQSTSVSVDVDGIKSAQKDATGKYVEYAVLYLACTRSVAFTKPK